MKGEEGAGHGPPEPHTTVCRRVPRSQSPQPGRDETSLAPPKSTEKSIANDHRFARVDETVDGRWNQSGYALTQVLMNTEDHCEVEEGVG